jgi:hypothetical protein
MNQHAIIRGTDGIGVYYVVLRMDICQEPRGKVSQAESVGVND